MVPSQTHLTLIEQGQPLVYSLARAVMRRLPMRVDLDDLVGYGQLGLAEAARKFDEDRGIQFTTFAYYRIKGAIFDGVSKMSWTSRGRLNRLRQISESGGEEVSSPDGDLARVFLSSHFDPGAGAAAEVEVVDWSRSPVAIAVNREAASKLVQLVRALPRLQRVLIESIYYEGTTLQEAATRLGISKSWASRVHAQTLEKLALSLRNLGME